jgi:hypothetical protein
VDLEYDFVIQNIYTSMRFIFIYTTQTCTKCNIRGWYVLYVYIRVYCKTDWVRGEKKGGDESAIHHLAVIHVLTNLTISILNAILSSPWHKQSIKSPLSARPTAAAATAPRQPKIIIITLNELHISTRASRHLTLSPLPRHHYYNSQVHPETNPCDRDF